MNKKLMALAIAAALAPAAAMADSGNVSIYGIVDGSVDVINPGYNNSASQTVNRISSNSSRIGFKGAEDMGNGLSAIWQLETGFNVDGAVAADLNSRNTFIGLSSKTMGTALLGKHDTPYKLATRRLDVFGDGIADNRSIMGGGGSGTSLGFRTQTTTLSGFAATSAGGNIYSYGRATTAASAVANFDGRQNNVLAYISPTISGFHAAVAYVAGGEDATANSAVKGKAWSATGIYDNGPLFASLAYERHSFGANGSGTVAGPAGLGTITSTTFTGASLQNRTEKAWKLGLGYKLDALQLGLAYEKTSDDLNGGSNALGHSAYYLSAAYTMGANVLKAAYTHAGDMADNSSTGAKQWAVGVDHNMSKRTKVYALYTKLDNEDSAAYTLSGGNASLAHSSSTVGSSPSAWSLGVRHSF